MVKRKSRRRNEEDDVQSKGLVEKRPNDEERRKYRLYKKIKRRKIAIESVRWLLYIDQLSDALSQYIHLYQLQVHTAGTICVCILCWSSHCHFADLFCTMLPYFLTLCMKLQLDIR